MITVKINVDTGVIMQKISFLLLGTSLSLIPTLTFAQCNVSRRKTAQLWAILKPLATEGRASNAPLATNGLV